MQTRKTATKISPLKEKKKKGKKGWLPCAHTRKTESPRKGSETKRQGTFRPPVAGGGEEKSQEEPSSIL